MLNISAKPKTALVRQSIILIWSASNTGAANCDALGAWSGRQATSGSVSVTAAAAGTASYTLTCGATTKTATVAVSAGTSPAPVVSIALTPANLATG